LLFDQHESASQSSGIDVRLNDVRIPAGSLDESLSQPGVAAN
jgi:hypothetical protein